MTLLIDMVIIRLTSLIGSFSLAVKVSLKVLASSWITSSKDFFPTPKSRMLCNANRRIFFHLSPFDQTRPINEDIIRYRFELFSYQKRKFHVHVQEFQGGGGVFVDTAGALGAAHGPQKPWDSCNLANSKHFIQTFEKPCFPIL